MKRITAILFGLSAALMLQLPLLPGAFLSAQTAPQVRAGFSADTVMIGDQYTLDVEIDKDIMQLVEFPTFEQGTIAQKMEILSESDVDTVAEEGRRVTLKKTYLLTCFDAGDYRSGRYPALYVDKNIVDTVWSQDSLKLLVNTFPIDTLTQAIYDIKPPAPAPFRVGEVSGYILWSLLALAVVAAAILLVRKYLRRRQGETEPIENELPHERAIRRLENLHAQKLWQSGKFKLYYTGITDILREYIERRYNIRAMEMTSSEILDAIKACNLDQALSERLSDVLLTSDYVKFAKYVPAADKHDEVYREAYYFVEDTKEIEPPDAEEEGGEQ